MHVDCDIVRMSFVSKGLLVYLPSPRMHASSATGQDLLGAQRGTVVVGGLVDFDPSSEGSGTVVTIYRSPGI